MMRSLNFQHQGLREGLLACCQAVMRWRASFAAFSKLSRSRLPNEVSLCHSPSVPLWGSWMVAVPVRKASLGRSFSQIDTLRLPSLNFSLSSAAGSA